MEPVISREDCGAATLPITEQLPQSRARMTWALVLSVSLNLLLLVALNEWGQRKKVEGIKHQTTLNIELRREAARPAPARAEMPVPVRPAPVEMLEPELVIEPAPLAPAQEPSVSAEPEAEQPLPSESQPHKEPEPSASTQAVLPQPPSGDKFERVFDPRLRHQLQQRSHTGRREGATPNPNNSTMADAQREYAVDDKCFRVSGSFDNQVYWAKKCKGERSESDTIAEGLREALRER